MHNIVKWSDTFKKSCSKYWKILKVSDHFGDIMHESVRAGLMNGKCESNYISLTEDFIQVPYLTLYWSIHNSSTLRYGIGKMSF